MTNTGKTKTDNADHLIWVDLEMTGLDPDQDLIIEIATIVTDKNLNIVAEGPTLAIHQDEDIIAQMDEWNTKTHGQSGLIDKIRASEINVQDAENLTLEFLNQQVPANSSPICGNSICQDRRFLYRHMPKLEAFFHYRNLDVSSIKELVKRWSPGLLENFKKQNQHTALADILESIAELKYYRKTFIKSDGLE